MEIPAKIKIPLCIEQGCVFNFILDFDDSKRESKNRYFVVLNANPKTDIVLIMLTSTTQIEKKYEFVRKAGISEETIVKVTPQEYSVFTHESVFNCNDVFEIEMKDLIRKIEENGNIDYQKISESIIKRLINGVKKSPKVAEDLKKLL